MVCVPRFTMLSHIGEFGLIEKIKKEISLSSSVSLGIGDDAAVVNLFKDKKLLLTTDMLVEGVHFTKRTKPFLIGYKALAVSISDIAAMGGLPKNALISLGVSKKKEVSYVKNLYKGFKVLAKEFNIDIVGGDTVKSDKLIINIALTGEVINKHLVKRSNAKIGHKIFVTGLLGKSYESGHHLRFVPRIKESQYLVKNFKPTAMIDISDGLASDLGHILKSSNVSAVIYEDRIPLRKGASLKDALSDGEDFELLFTLTKKKAKQLLLSNKKYLFYEIGEIVDKKRKPLVILNGEKEASFTFQGYKHF